MKSLRSRLIIAFLGVALLAMIPLALVPYYTLHVKNQAELSDRIHATEEQIYSDIDRITKTLLNDCLIPACEKMKTYITSNAKLQEAFEEGKNPELITINTSYVQHAFLKKESPQKKFFNFVEFYSKDEYEEMKDWLDYNLLYEEDDTLYLWTSFPIILGETKSEMRPVGVALLKIPFINKKGEKQNTYAFNAAEHYDPMPVVLPANPALFEDHLTRQQFERLFDLDSDGAYDIIEAKYLRLPAVKNGSPVHALLRPILNHRQELSAIMVLPLEVVSVWKMVGPATVTSFIAILIVIVFAAIFVARSLSQPVYRLASAAQRMSQGNLSTRVEVAGTQEQQVLSYAFNQLASRIQNQVIQLQHKTNELEEINRRLAQTHRFLENILVNINTGVLSVDTRECITHINKYGRAVFGTDEYLNRPIEEVIRCPSFVHMIRYCLKQGTAVYQEEIHYENHKSEMLQLQISLVPLFEEGDLVGLVCTFHDLSAIRKLEEQVRRQDRLAALGHMAAGVAHEIRNPLSIIRGSAELLQKRVPEDSTEKELAQFIQEEVRRLSNVVTDFLNFARPPQPSIAEVMVADLLTNVAAYTENQDEWEPYSIQIDIKGELPPIAADENLCRQVFLNLLINARDAMPNGGKIRLRAYQAVNTKVIIEIIDTGSGIHPEQLDRIFDPFYTSKDSGTGLGLSLVHQIIAGHGGQIEVDSQPGKGSTFRLILPIYETIDSPASLENA